MRRHFFSVVVIVVITFFNSFSQESNIIGRWTLSGIYSCYNNQSEINSNSKVSYIFKNNGKVEIVQSSSSTLSIEQNYRIDNNQLKFDFIDYEIKYFNNDTLILIQHIDNSCRESIFISENILISKQKENYFINGGDTIYHPIPENHPTLKGQKSYKDYVISEFSKRMSNVTTNCKVKVQFTIDKDGNIIKPIAWNSCNEKYNKTLLKIINKTENKWTPLTIYGKSVSCFVKIEFTHSFAGIFNN